MAMSAATIRRALHIEPFAALNVTTDECGPADGPGDPEVVGLDGDSTDVEAEEAQPLIMQPTRRPRAKRGMFNSTLCCCATANMP